VVGWPQARATIEVRGDHSRYRVEPRAFLGRAGRVGSGCSVIVRL